LSAEGFVEVVEGLTAGEFVVARAGSFLRNGDMVRPVPAQDVQNRTASSEGPR
jgi:HlyD family secretion protein